jgi:hypothetical protein
VLGCHYDLLGWKQSDIEYFAQFQEDTADPYVYVSRNEGETDPKKLELIQGAHRNFMKILQDKDYDTSEIPEPVGTVMAIWWARDKESSLLPQPSHLGPGEGIWEDPLQLIDQVSKPLEDYDIYIANEAFSGGNGWAHPALVMTEKILWRYFGSKPAWLVETEDCVTGFNCSSHVTSTWWEMFIFSPAHPTQPECPIAECPKSVARPNFHLTWKWISPTDITINFQIEAAGWVALGVGSSMASADVVIAFPNGTVQQRNSTKHSEPALIPPERQTIYNARVERSGNLLKVSFSRKVNSWNSATSINLHGLTDIIFAAYDDNFGATLPQHTLFNQAKAPFYCNYFVPPLWEKDILPLFREKDREFMLFQMDL